MDPTQPKKRGPPKARPPPPQKTRKQRPNETAAPAPKAHPNELGLCASYDRCDRERFDLDPARTTYAALKVPPRFLRGRQIMKLPVSKDGWAPHHLKKPQGFPGTWKQLCENWAREFPHLLPKCEADCVWGDDGKGWTPAKPAPSWWRLDYHEDDTYRVLCFCFSRNHRCYQPGLGLDLDEFCTHALKGDKTAKALLAINRELKTIGQVDWDAKHTKPEKCDDSVYVERCLLLVDGVAVMASGEPSHRRKTVRPRRPVLPHRLRRAQAVADPLRPQGADADGPGLLVRALQPRRRARLRPLWPRPCQGRLRARRRRLWYERRVLRSTCDGGFVGRCLIFVLLGYEEGRRLPRASYTLTDAP